MYRLDDEQLRWLRNEITADVKRHLVAAGGGHNGGPPRSPGGNGNGNKTAVPKRLLSVIEASKYLGLSKSAIEHKLHRDPEFRACTVSGFGRRVMFCVKKLEEFIQRHGRYTWRAN
jgi:predicted DNA-binding transcriptional regulator AlpA